MRSLSSMAAMVSSLGRSTEIWKGMRPSRRVWRMNTLNAVDMIIPNSLKNSSARYFSSRSMRMLMLVVADAIVSSPCFYDVIVYDLHEKNNILHESRKTRAELKK